MPLHACKLLLTYNSLWFKARRQWFDFQDRIVHVWADGYFGARGTLVPWTYCCSFLLLPKHIKYNTLSSAYNFRCLRRHLVSHWHKHWLGTAPVMSLVGRQQRKKSQESKLHQVKILMAAIYMLLWSIILCLVISLEDWCDVAPCLVLWLVLSDGNQTCTGLFMELSKITCEIMFTFWVF